MRRTHRLGLGGVVVGGLMASLGWTISAQTVSQFCPPCAAIGEAQKVPDDLAREVLTNRSWVLGPQGINTGAWQARRGAAYRLGTGATLLQIDTGITQHPLLPPFNKATDSGVDFTGADNFFGVGYSNEDPLLSGLLRFPGHGTKTSSVITATAPPLQPAIKPTATLQNGGTLADVKITLTYSYLDTVSTRESVESEPVEITPAGRDRIIRVTVTGTSDPLVGQINVYAQDRDDPGRRLAGSVANPGAGTATVDIRTKDWGTKAEAPTSTPWRLKTITDGERMRGAAPGVHHIPLRGTQGVLLIPKLGELDAEPWRIANALRQAALGEKGLFRRRIDVVSMSLGTWPETQGLCNAVDEAAKAGVIVVAAAGNQIKRTKYPAKCTNAIGVAGSNYQQRPWSGSAGSPGIAVAAPAEGVWTASVVEGTYCMEASYGTSFATALVAAVASEWVAFRREQKTLPDGLQRTAAFRAALMKTARPWSGSDASTWKQKFGPGIADLSQLMMGEAQNAPR